ncbi:hypothetical protein ALC60_07719 [Trachymyrmex zeteki]|uniref:Uncharacterized protein n=1 Tax=Mycetomoellerius zeteki TaxID=64791 RepID=A0A151WYN9_9HYME|nr:hypothetical protein ALC60_07719 [Trachymyrmex zeteki]
MKTARTIQKTFRHWVIVCSDANSPTMYGVMIPSHANGEHGYHQRSVARRVGGGDNKDSRAYGGDRGAEFPHVGARHDALDDHPVG